MFARDKKLHFWAGLAIAIVAGPFAFFVIDYFWPTIALVVTLPLLGLILAAAVGALKEIIWDWWWKRGTPEWLDFVATVIGGSIGALLLGIVKGMMK